MSALRGLCSVIGGHGAAGTGIRHVMQFFWRLRVVAAVLVVGAALGLPAPADASVQSLRPGQAAAEAVIERLATWHEDFVEAAKATLAPLGRSPEDVYRFLLSQHGAGYFHRMFAADMQDSLVAGCRADKAAVTYAVLVGADTIGERRKQLVAPRNDVALLRTQLQGAGVAGERIVTLVGDQANRVHLEAALRAVLGRVNCEDRVILSFSGFGFPLGEDMLKRMIKERGKPFQVVWPDYLADDAVAEFFEMIGFVFDVLKLFDRADPYLAKNWDMERLKRFEDFGPLLDPDAYILLNDNLVEYAEFVLGRDISDFMWLVRRRGAHAITILDMSAAGSAMLETRERQNSGRDDWRFRYALSGEAERRPDSGGYGDFAVFYAADKTENTPEMPLPRNAKDAKRFGYFTFHLAGALTEPQRATPRLLGEALQKAYSADKRFRPHARIEASNPDLVLIPEARPQADDPIRIISPAEQRGAAAMQQAELTIEGVVEWPQPVVAVLVNNEDAVLAPGSRFSSKITLKPGLNPVSIVAVTADSRMHKRRLDLVFEGDLKALEGEGRRYAVIIANQNYGEATGMPDLSTPFADADALAAVLAGTYGFTTQLTLPNGKALPLLLKDPTKRDIEVALFQLGKVAGKRDTVLIFYAGHGVFEPVTSTAYWVPSDAEQGFEPSYLSAADISAAIQRLQADHVILISDSCYSGALMRGGPPPAGKVDMSERVQALLKLNAQRSRIVMTSGNNEPVADRGGSGHSVFARALLTGLEQMDHDAFSARELFDGYVLHQVMSNADQEPQYRPLEKVAHEGGDFVFVKAAAALPQAGAQPAP